MTGMSIVVDETFQKPLYGLSLRLSLVLDQSAGANADASEGPRVSSGAKPAIEGSCLGQ